MSNEKLKDGDRVILTGWKKDLGHWSKNFIKDSDMSFPKDVSIQERDDRFFWNGWELDFWFEYETATAIPQPKTESPVFTTITPDQMQFICQKFGLSTKSGVQPGTVQAVLCAPDGTSSVFFICHTSPVNVTVHDAVGDTSVTIHDKI